MGIEKFMKGQVSPVKIKDDPDGNPIMDMTEEEARGATDRVRKEYKEPTQPYNQFAEQIRIRKEIDDQRRREEELKKLAKEKEFEDAVTRRTLDRQEAKIAQGQRDKEGLKRKYAENKKDKGGMA